MWAHGQVRWLLGCQCAVGDSRRCVPGPLAQGLTHISARCSLPSRGLRKCAVGMTSVLSLQIVLLSWMVCSCASVALAPCGLGLSWDQ